MAEHNSVMLLNVSLSVKNLCAKNPEYTSTTVFFVLVVQTLCVSRKHSHLRGKLRQKHLMQVIKGLEETLRWRHFGNKMEDHYLNKYWFYWCTDRMQPALNHSFRLWFSYMAEKKLQQSGRVKRNISDGKIQCHVLQPVKTASDYVRVKENKMNIV